VRFPVIPANPGSSPGQAPESSYFKHLKILWTPVSTGVTTFYDSTKINGIFKNCPYGPMEGPPGLPPLLAFDQRSRESSIDKDSGRDMLKASEEGR